MLSSAARLARVTGHKIQTSILAHLGDDKVSPPPTSFPRAYESISAVRDAVGRLATTSDAVVDRRPKGVAEKPSSPQCAG